MRKFLTMSSLFIFLLTTVACKHPSNSQAFYINGGFMGIRTDNMVKFYQTRDQRTWVYGPGRDFTSPVKMDGVFYFGGSGNYAYLVVFSQCFAKQVLCFCIGCGAGVVVFVFVYHAAVRGFIAADRLDRFVYYACDTDVFF